MIFPHTCIKCGITTEPSLVQVGCTLVVYCGNKTCTRLVTYRPSTDYPAVEDIKRAIFDLLHRDVSKAVAMFPPDKKFTRLQYWTAYRNLFGSYYGL